MNNFDDEMRRVFADRRIGQVPNPPSVSDLVRGASRRRTRRVVVSAVSAVGVVAALAVGAPALVDFTNTAGPDIAPAITPSDTADPTGDPTAPPSDPSEPPDDGDTLPVIDPVDGFDGVRIGMSIAEVESVAGVEIIPSNYEPNDFCYGEFHTPTLTGWISVRTPFGAEATPAASDDDFVVTFITPDVPATTPEGIGVGSPWSDVEAAYANREEYPIGESAVVQNDPPLRWIFGDGGGDEVSIIYLDGGQACVN